MSSTQTADEMFFSLNGFDELAIAKHFGVQLHELHPSAGGSPFMYLRALAFIDRRRNGVADRDAFKQAMELGANAAQEYFAEPADDLDPDDPDTEAGKGSEPSD
jgi:hypothetical protein